MNIPANAPHLNNLYSSFYQVIEHSTNTEIFLWEDSKWLAIDESFHGDVMPYLTRINVEGEIILTLEDTVENNQNIRDVAESIGMPIQMCLDRKHYHVTMYGRTTRIGKQALIDMLNGLEVDSYER
ncbi:hypothetical protein VP405E501_P0076 [Vibrio phage 405E50-1]|nr:hypothetical protein VP521E561_P0076 [Vibrio phage 521E56-1]CAH9013145.1 hypothetical protein VP384E501_P0076 [Vibrio phage 384E50-1]CAH9013208.1 hypothetical protein VP402E501_P0076 [Vibrio phage 402E50-1]CAH9013873.1 hypothetical protein VP405E501_P0076 [Vibrio phage 405E50-1]CAH9013929.1 hypothetical protein VP413E501_P0076 [Vibrio phage 413E50-1]